MCLVTPSEFVVTIFFCPLNCFGTSAANQFTVSRSQVSLVRFHSYNFFTACNVTFFWLLSQCTFYLCFFILLTMCGFLYNYPAWNLLNFLDLEDCVFLRIWKDFGHLLNIVFFCLIISPLPLYIVRPLNIEL